MIFPCRNRSSDRQARKVVTIRTTQSSFSLGCTVCGMSDFISLTKGKGHKYFLMKYLYSELFLELFVQQEQQQRRRRQDV